MSQDVVYKFTGDSSQLLQEMQKLLVAQEAEKQKLKEIQTASRAAAVQQASDQKEAQKVIQGTRTELEKYNDKIQHLNLLLEKGHITAEQHARGLSAAREQLRKTQPELDRTKGGVLSLASQFAASASVATVFTMALTASNQAIINMREEGEKTITTIDKLHRQFALQSGQTVAGSIQDRAAILSVAEDDAVDAEQAFRVATQLQGLGFQGSTGKALDAMLDAASAMSVNAEALTGAVAGFNEKFGGAKTGEAARQFAGEMFGLYQKSDFQAAHLESYTRAAPAFAGAGIDRQTSLAVLNTLYDLQKSPEQAATAAQGILTSLRTAAANTTKEQGLQMLSLKPEQVDLTGEGIGDVLSLLQRSLQALPEEQRPIALTKIFGESYSTAAAYLAENTGKIDSYVAAQRGGGALFEGAVTESQSGINAELIRSDIRLQRIRLEKEANHTMEALAAARLREQDARAQQSGTTGYLFNLAEQGFRYSFGRGFSSASYLDQATQDKVMQQAQRMTGQNVDVPASVQIDRSVNGAISGNIDQTLRAIEVNTRQKSQPNPALKLNRN